ncbi:MAG: hypothetical protein ACXWQO_18995 [Bdellovibrionota bacterium]
MRKLLLALALLPSLAFARDKCDERNNHLKGDIKAAVNRFDDFVISLQGKKNPRTDIQKFLETTGLPLSAEVQKGGVKKSVVKGWVESEGISGESEGKIFAKKMQVPAKSGLRLDEVFLFEKADSKKPVHTWKVPYNNFYPAGLNGDELIFHGTIYPMCKEGDSVEFMLAEKPDGSLRTVEWPKDSETKQIEKCEAKKRFKQSDYAACSEILDTKSKKKMVLVWEQPMS